MNKCNANISDQSVKYILAVLPSIFSDVMKQELMYLAEIVKIRTS